MINLCLYNLDESFAVCRLPAGSGVPQWATRGAFWSVTATRDEVSVVCAEELVPVGVVADRGWRALAVEGPLDFALTGILSSLTVPLAEAGVPVFALSTHDTDYLLVKEDTLKRATDRLRAAGHRVSTG